MNRKENPSNKQNLCSGYQSDMNILQKNAHKNSSPNFTRQVDVTSAKTRLPKNPGPSKQITFPFLLLIHPRINASLLTGYQPPKLPRRRANKLHKHSDSAVKLSILLANFMFLSQHWRSIRKLLFCQLSHLAKQLQFINSVECEWINMFHWAMCHLLIGYWWDYWRAAN